MTLDDYRVSRGLTYEELAKEVGVKKTSLFYAVKKKGNITLDVAFRIVQKTNGEVGFKDLLSQNYKDCSVVKEA